MNNKYIVLTLMELKLCLGALLTYSEVLHGANNRKPLPSNVLKRCDELRDRMVNAREGASDLGSKQHVGVEVTFDEGATLLTALAVCATDPDPEEMRILIDASQSDIGECRDIVSRCMDGQSK